MRKDKPKKEKNTQNSLKKCFWSLEKEEIEFCINMDSIQTISFIL